MADCTNDCKAPLIFPKTIFNRPGLPRIEYRIGTIRISAKRCFEHSIRIRCWRRGHTAELTIRASH